MINSIPVEPAIGVGAIVFDPSGRVLLVRRARPPKLGLWSAPGGRLEPGETLADCCRREVLEETGITIEPGPIVAVADRVSEGFHYIIFDFAAALACAGVPEPIPASDVSEARWVGPAELLAYTLVEGLAVVIEAVRASLETGAALGLSDVDGDSRLFVPVSLPGG